MLSDSERYALDLQGFCIQRGAFEPERVEALSAALRALEGVEREALPEGVVVSATPVLDEWRAMNLAEADPRFLELVDDARLLRWAESCVPQPCRLTECFGITRRAGIGLPLHCLEWACYEWRHGGPRTQFLTAMIALSDCGPEDGPLVVFAGSHKLRAPFPYARVHPDWRAPEHDAAASEAWRAQNEGKPAVPWEEIPGYTEVHVRAGDLVVMTHDLWHGAKELRSGRVRRSLFLSYGAYHHANWHGVQTTAALFERANARQRELLGGPFVGNRYPGAPDPHVPECGTFPVLPDSERGLARFREEEPASPAHAPDADLAERVRQSLQRFCERPAPHSEGAPLGACRLRVLGAGEWGVALHNGSARLSEAQGADCDCAIEIEAEDWFALVEERADPTELFYRGRLRARGDLSLAMRFVDRPQPPPS